MPRLRKSKETPQQVFPVTAKVPQSLTPELLEWATHALEALLVIPEVRAQRPVYQDLKRAYLKVDHLWILLAREPFRVDDPLDKSKQDLSATKPPVFQVYEPSPEYQERTYLYDQDAEE